MEHYFVLDLVDQDYLEEIQKSAARVTNGECLRQSLTDKNLRLRIQNLLSRNAHMYPGPCLHIELASDDMAELEIDSDDIKDVCEVFGKVVHVDQVDVSRVYVLFENVVDCFFAQKILNGHHIQDLNIQMLVRWGSKSDLLEVQRRNAEVHRQRNQAPKFTCRYEILLESEGDFQVARKIIGSKGCNMKKIIDQCSDSQAQIVKLRLRGKGSGYKEGPSKQESGEPLHLCVSSKSSSHFAKACSLVESLLQKIFDEYTSQRHQRKQVLFRKICNNKIQQQPNTTKISYFEFPSLQQTDKLMMR